MWAIPFLFLHKGGEVMKVSSQSQFVLWFGAAVSIAEILTGALVAPLGLGKGLAAILIGHLIGAIILYLCGMIGATSKLSSIESTRISFGLYGSYIFSILNIIQLIGWTAVMIINGSKAMDAVSNQLFNFNYEAIWTLVIGALIGIWILIGIKGLNKVNLIAVGALFILSVILGVIVFTSSGGSIEMNESLSFGSAVELNVAMSLSWIPLIADYTKHVKDERKGTLYSVLGYFIGSMLMFVIGLGAALFTGTSDISTILISAELGLVAFIIVLLSTVTTTFLDVHSAAISFLNLTNKVNEKTIGLIVTVIGVLIALLVPMTQYENFLYLIGSVFAPLFAILITDYFILNHKVVDASQLLNVKNMMIWVIGFIAYRSLMPYNSVIGMTLPVMLGISLLTIIVQRLPKRKINGGIEHV